MKSKYKTFWWLITAFSFTSMLKVLYYQFLKSIKRLDYNKTFEVKFNHKGEQLHFILRYNRDDFAILRGTFMSKVYDIEVEDVTTIIDAGSHIGCVAIYYAKKYPDANILCFEPDKESYNLSIKNAFLNNVVLLTFNYGISDKKGVVKFSKDIRNPSYSLVSPEGEEQISVFSLDDIISNIKLNRVDILKLDIEGHEPQAFRGLVKNLDKVKYILLENHTFAYSLKEIKSIIKKKGYKILPELPIWEELYDMKDAMFLLKKEIKNGK